MRQKRASEVRTFGTFEPQLVELREWLTECGVTSVAMEATGVYWKPVWHVLDDGVRFELLLVNPAHIKNMPGRKTDVNDATWIARSWSAACCVAASCHRSRSVSFVR